MEKFWEIEDLGDKRYLSKGEEACEQHFQQNIQRKSSGQYMVRLPFKGDVNSLGPSYDLARRRFFALERKLEKDPKLKRMYH